MTGQKMQRGPENGDNFTNQLQFFFHLVPHPLVCSDPKACTQNYKSFKQQQWYLLFSAFPFLYYGGHAMPDRFNIYIFLVNYNVSIMYSA